MEFKKYQHIERLETEEVEGIEIGETYIFPKIDGTNGSIWLENDIIKAGSRKRVLSLEDDNRGFYAHVLKNTNIRLFFRDYPSYRLFGEWLVPHSLKTYRKDAWNKFYIFDVCVDNDEGGLDYQPYPLYQPLLELYGLDYILPICSIKNGNYEQFIQQIDKNVFLIEDGQGVGEGIVIKNYKYRNKYGRTTWAKIVRSEFKDLHTKSMGTAKLNGKKMVEEEIVEKYCTESLIKKTYAKIVTESNGWSSKYIPRLLSTVYHDLVTEDIWNIVKKMKNPTINFKKLNCFIVQKIKCVKHEIF